MCWVEYARDPGEWTRAFFRRIYDFLLSSLNYITDVIFRRGSNFLTAWLSTLPGMVVSWVKTCIYKVLYFQCS